MAKLMLHLVTGHLILLKATHTLHVGLQERRLEKSYNKIAKMVAKIGKLEGNLNAEKVAHCSV